MRKIAFLLIMMNIMFAIFVFSDIQINQEVHDRFAKLLQRHHEVMIFVFEDGTIIEFSHQNQQHVRIKYSDLAKEFRKKGKLLRNAIIIIHNHLYNSGFSNNDLKLYEFFSSKGFKGSFALWYRSRITEMIGQEIVTEQHNKKSE